ncbi:CBS domain-containing protein YkuL [Planococcus massiliensis]|mgnify:CR=1 FL=1|uniref:CBS domain-containing protein YkuL n=1 Tax=Planococcus massiliensis TaxID=1499687 RepID=A0A098EM01_9BACL|nr:MULTISPECIES: cyclic-di-AMP-binding protein CbpB [Planococcus]MCJ1907082.1 CBS domain-containing protein [Planococcus ruber]UJF25895.1 CBS domain-containing protein [Planococcus sp. 107-1]GKW45038.1 CBS domain-containing protein [Planococcus sp. NCCP-2050]CEG22316.1 CBS domain-containing protein YkuL [Planococcus massiliensis]
MISLPSRDFLDTPIEEFIISSEKVAHVQLGNSAEHALLVLTKTGYSAIPVLDPKYRFCGLINAQRITDAILGLEHIEYERLPDIKVDEIMQTDLPLINITERFQRALDLLIDQNFLCVVDAEGMFMGILTRRVILKQLKKQIYQLRK